MLSLAFIGAACGDPGPVAAPVESSLPPPTSHLTTTTTTTTSTTPPDMTSESFREEWFIETNTGAITALGEHTPEAHRWLEIFGTDPDDWSREVISIGDEAWNRYAGDEWQEIGQDGIVTDLLNGHPFELSEVLADFTPTGTDTYAGRQVTTYSAVGPGFAKYSGIDPATIVETNIAVSVFGDETFATYELYYERDTGEWANLTYRTYDFGAPIVIERPQVVPVVVTCRDRGRQLIDEIGAYRSRYDLLHPGAAFSSIEELRSLDPWAWQLTVRFAGNDEAHVDTLWVDGGAQYWREPGQDWQPDIDQIHQSMVYRPFVDDVWIPDLVERFTPVGQAEVAGRIVDVYELGLEEIQLLNNGLVHNTDTLEATFWIEPCWAPQLIKLELTATGRGYAEGEFHIVYELFDLGTTDTIDIPAEALEG